MVEIFLDAFMLVVNATDSCSGLSIMDQTAIVDSLYINNITVLSKFTLRKNVDV